MADLARMFQKLVSTSQVSDGCRGISNEWANYIKPVLTFTSIPEPDLDKFTQDVHRLLVTLKLAIKLIKNSVKVGT